MTDSHSPHGQTPNTQHKTPNTKNARPDHRRLRLHRRMDHSQPARSRRPGLGLRPPGRSPAVATHPAGSRGQKGRVRSRRRDRSRYSSSRHLDTRHHAHHSPGRAASADLPGRPHARGEGERTRHAGGLRGRAAVGGAGEAARLRQLAPRSWAVRTSIRRALWATTCCSMPTHALRRLQVLQRRQRPHLLPGLRSLVDRPAGPGPSTASVAISA